MKRSDAVAGSGNMRHGLISLLTVVVVISLATAAVLTIATSHAMAALAQRQATMAAEGYAAEQSAQSLLAGLDEELVAARKAKESGTQLLARVENRINSLLVAACAQGVTATYDMEDNILTCTFITQSGRSLEATIAVSDDATYDVVGWRLTAAPDDSDNGDTLWTGSTAGE